MQKNINIKNTEIMQLEQKIGYSFKNKSLLAQSMMHSSYANENREEDSKSNERLEFLGDAVLNVVTSTYIYDKYSNLTEGEMTKLRAAAVCEPTLAKCAQWINLGDYIKLGKCELTTGGKKRSSLLCDAFEAIIGAIYVDSGIDDARKFILSNLEQYITPSITKHAYVDFKTMLQEWVQRDGESKISYEIIKEAGPDHNKTFISIVKVQDNECGKGKGKSKKESEQIAAKQALIKLGGFNE